MTFILVTLAIMGASIFLIYKLTNRFGFRMKYKSLFLCAFMAFLVNIAAISMSPYLTRAHYIRLILLVIAAAAVVTIYNEYLLRREGVPSTGAGVPPIEEAPELEEKKSSRFFLPELHLPNLSTPLAEQITSLKGLSPPVGLLKRFKDGIKLPRFPFGKSDVNAEEPRELPEETAPTAKIDLSRFSSLDDILDYAFEQKSANHPDEAILAYRGALKKYGDDAYAPFIVIDLGNIYKEMGAYEDAMRTYREALSLPVIANDAATWEKFNENLSYLDTVRCILSKHHSLSIPFRDIPSDYLKEIEAEFQLRQKS